MLKQLIVRFLPFAILAEITLISCERDSTHDLFPLEVGNEFYYWHDETTGPVSQKKIGVETWRVVSELHQGDSTVYTVERNLKATCILVWQQDTFYTEITDSFEIIENQPFSIISFLGFKFMRYQDVSHLKLSRQGGSSSATVSCLFETNRGLVKYDYYYQSMRVIQIKLTLDSLKTAHRYKPQIKKPYF